jgi:hypothetical protein
MRGWNVSDSNSSFAPGLAQADHPGHSGRHGDSSIGPAHILKEHAMWINTAHARLAVDDRRGLRLNAARGTQLRAVKGTLWITIDNDPRDIVLDPGERFAVDTNQPLFVMALGERATLDLCNQTRKPEPRTPPQGAWLARLWSRRSNSSAAQVALRGAATA